jgi:hypothetical protein
VFFHPLWFHCFWPSKVPNLDHVWPFWSKKQKPNRNVHFMEKNAKAQQCDTWCIIWSRMVYTYPMLNPGPFILHFGTKTAHFWLDGSQAHLSCILVLKQHISGWMGTRSSYLGFWY